jgi:hypothetical protein
MSGNYQDWSADAPGGKNESAAAVAAGLNEAMAAFATTQAESAAFMSAYGEAVLPGHPPVNAPGRQGDPDTAADAADSGG